MNPPLVSQDEESEDYIRLNVLMPKDALAKLDSMKNYAGFGSRGRTIQALVEKVWNTRDTLKMIMLLFKNIQTTQHRTALDYYPVILELTNLIALIRIFVNIEMDSDDVQKKVDSKGA